MERIKQAREIFKKIDESLKSQYKGKIVAIEPETGDYFIGDSALEAYQNATKKHPAKKFIFRRIGFAATHFVGAV